MNETDLISIVIPVLANSFAGNTKEIEVRHESRSNGDSKYSLWKLINLQFDLLTSMTTFPLRLLSVVESKSYYGAGYEDVQQRAQSHAAGE